MGQSYRLYMCPETSLEYPLQDSNLRPARLEGGRPID